jgi:hypothetical protein
MGIRRFTLISLYKLMQPMKEPFCRLDRSEYSARVGLRKTISACHAEKLSNSALAAQLPSPFPDVVFCPELPKSKNPEQSFPRFKPP